MGLRNQGVQWILDRCEAQGFKIYLSFRSKAFRVQGFRVENFGFSVCDAGSSLNCAEHRKTSLLY